MQLQIPHVRPTTTSKQLVVNGEPFLMRAGELQNSSFSSHRYMAEAWPKLAEANINTVLGSVSWEQIEPEEGRFDFKELDECLRGARQHDVKLVLLWFGSFKNGMLLVVVSTVLDKRMLMIYGQVSLLMHHTG
jgi:GH35 family endo-1,4-beta-xylanase